MLWIEQKGENYPFHKEQYSIPPDFTHQLAGFMASPLIYHQRTQPLITLPTRSRFGFISLISSEFNFRSALTAQEPEFLQSHLAASHRWMQATTCYGGKHYPESIMQNAWALDGALDSLHRAGNLRITFSKSTDRRINVVWIQTNIPQCFRKPCWVWRAKKIYGPTNSIRLLK